MWIKVANGFPEHPKTVGLSDKAFRTVVEFWCYCHRNNTDGRVPLVMFTRLPPKVRRELLVHYVVAHEDHIEMHDYLTHQQSAEEIAELKAKRQRAGRAGGKARAQRQASAKANAKQNGSPAQPDLDIDIDIEKERGAEAPPQRSRAVALPASFGVTEAMKAWAREKAPGVDLAHETDKFRNFHQSKGSTFKDWQAAWRTWITKAVEYSKSNPAAVAAGGQREWW